jgi:spiro-SPASM protein
MFCDSPFLDIEIIKDMIETHVKYLAEFTYSENLPGGYACEIISKELLKSVPESSQKMLPLSEVIRFNINKFDVELYYREPDIRNRRISFRSGNPREKKIMENIYSISGKTPLYSGIKDIIDNNPELLYTGPSYVEVELTGRCSLDCIFCYRKTLKQIHQDMDIDIFKKILSDMRSFQLPYSLCFGGSGEPIMHDRFYEICDLALKEDALETLVIETNGIFADNNFKNYILNKNGGRIKIVFNINGMDSGTCARIHGGDYFQAVADNILSLRESITGSDSIYIQIMKIKETEGFLDNYYNFWEKHKIPIILQKQNTFLSRVEDRRYSDLSPLERTPCWHLQRDVYILSDGRVGFCKQDVDGDFAKGDLKTETLSAVWQRSGSHFLNNYNNKLSVRPDCKTCDEWYTFNL